MAGYALILDGKVAQIADETFPVAEPMVWVSAPDGVEVGHSYDGHEFAPPYTPPPDLPGALAAHYRATRDGGTTIEGMAVQTDEGSRGLINGAVARAILRGTPERTFTFKAPTGAVIITDAQIMGIGMAVADHVQACIDAEAAVSAVLDDYDTEAEVQAAFDAAYAAAGGSNG